VYNLDYIKNRKSPTMSKPISIRKIIIEINVQNIVVLNEALKNYHKYLKDVQIYEHSIPLSKSAIKRRIRYLEDFLEALEVGGYVEAI